ncbi:hypothetical protein ACTXT7_003414 [Hymenolepis weldensis]
MNADEIVISESRRSKAFAFLAYPYSEPLVYPLTSFYYRFGLGASYFTPIVNTHITYGSLRRPQSRQDPIFPKSPLTTSSFSLLGCGFATLPYTVQLNIPPFGLLHAPFTISYTLENKTTLPQELNVQLESTESFVFCGVQLTSLRLLPNSSRKLDFTLLPLRPGYLQLPRICTIISSNTDNHAQTLMRLLLKLVDDYCSVPLVEILSARGKHDNGIFLFKNEPKEKRTEQYAPQVEVVAVYESE